MNEIISVPEYNIMNANLVLYMKTYSNNIFREHISNKKPIYYSTNRSDRKRLLSFYLNYIFDCDDIINWIQQYQIIDTKLTKFLSIERKTIFSHINNKHRENQEKWTIEIIYLKIREEIISYLEQKVGLNENVKKIKKMFEKKNELCFEEYLEEKTDYLLGLDLSKFVEEFNKPINLKNIENQ